MKKAVVVTLLLASAIIIGAWNFGSQDTSEENAPPGASIEPIEKTPTSIPPSHENGVSEHEIFEIRNAIDTLSKESELDNFTFKLLELTKRCNEGGEQFLELCRKEYKKLSNSLPRKDQIAEITLNLFSLGYSSEIKNELDRAYSIGAIDQETYFGELSRLIGLCPDQEATAILEKISKTKSQRAIEILTYTLAGGVSLGDYSNDTKAKISSYLNENIPQLPTDIDLLGISDRVAYENWLASVISVRGERGSENPSQAIMKMLDEGLGDPRRAAIIYFSPLYNSNNLDASAKTRILTLTREYAKSHPSSTIFEFATDEQRAALDF